MSLSETACPGTNITRDMKPQRNSQSELIFFGF